MVVVSGVASNSVVVATIAATVVAAGGVGGVGWTETVVATGVGGVLSALGVVFISAIGGCTVVMVTIDPIRIASGWKGASP